MTFDQWKTIGKFPNYEVSVSGQVRNVVTGRVLRPMWTGSKRKQYATVRLSDGTTVKDCKVHVLVLEAFVGPRPPGAVARHRDDDATNNAAINLRWGTYADNAQDRIRNGRDANMRATPEQAAEIYRRRSAGEAGKALAAEFNVSQQTVCDIFKGRRTVVGAAHS